MKYFVDILKQFTQTQRLIVLILLLSFTTGGVLFSQYLKTDDCRALVEENLKMQDDFIKIVELLRKERLKENEITLDSVVVPSENNNKKVPKASGIGSKHLMNEILKIAESNKK